MPNIAWNIFKLKCFYNSNLNGHLIFDLTIIQTFYKVRGGVWNPLPLVGYTDTKNKNNTNNKSKYHYTGYYTDQHHNEKTQLLFQMLLQETFVDFLKAGISNDFEIPGW